MANLRRLQLHLWIKETGETPSILLQPMGGMVGTDSLPAAARVPAAHCESGSVRTLSRDRDTKCNDGPPPSVLSPQQRPFMPSKEHYVSLLGVSVIRANRGEVSTPRWRFASTRIFDFRLNLQLLKQEHTTLDLMCITLVCKQHLHPEASLISSSYEKCVVYNPLLNRVLAASSNGRRPCFTCCKEIHAALGCTRNSERSDLRSEKCNRTALVVGTPTREFGYDPSSPSRPLTVVTLHVSWVSVLKGDGWLAAERLGLHFSGNCSQPARLQSYDSNSSDTETGNEKRQADLANSASIRAVRPEHLEWRLNRGR
ncbi:hypothetical protein INR49_024545 [Caranx melampygus]|nr:hypothetical protein INR49_024545 [Caranx melampygus]